MTPHYGIDTPLLTRLVTGYPTSFMLQLVALLTEMVRDYRSMIYASNLVIAECYLVLQHTYGVPKDLARVGLYRVLTSGLVNPVGGFDVLDELRADASEPLLDRLAVEEYRNAGLDTLTMNRRLGSLTSVRTITPDETVEAHFRMENSRKERSMAETQARLTRLTEEFLGPDRKLANASSNEPPTAPPAPRRGPGTPGPGR